MPDFVALTVFAGLPVRSLSAASDWYTKLLGREPDARPAPGVADYYLAQGRVPELGTFQLREDPARAGGGVMTLNVSDIESVAERLANLTVPFETQTFPIDAETVSSVTVGTFEDPDGNAVTVVQPNAR